MPELADINNCTGCGACVNACSHNAISMLSDAEGFLQPLVDKNSCIDCGLCNKSCPILNTQKTDNKKEPKVFASWHKEDRQISSSGGAFSSFARIILDKGGVVFGATMDDELNVKHIEISNLCDLQLLRGSKYVQSDIGSSLSKVKKRLQEGKWVLFSGTPCQIAGLKSFLQKDYEKLLTIDIACHGVPSNRIFKKYISKLQQRNKKTTNIDYFDFRKRNGWTKQSTVFYNKNKRYIYGIDDLYMSAFDKSAIFRKSCYNCKFSKIPRVGDITLADFWGIGRHGIPFKHDVTKGVSLILANTKRGENTLKELTNNTFVEERPLKEALIENHNLYAPSNLNPQRDEIIAAFLNEGLTLKDINDKFHLVDRSIKGIAKEWSSKIGLFDITKRVYNWYKTL